MKNCEKCGREYLDSYAECPFCKRSTTAQMPQISEDEQPGRSRSSLFIWMAVAILVIAACTAGSVLFASTSADKEAPSLHLKPLHKNSASSSSKL